MAIEFDDRPSESPYIERVWRGHTVPLPEYDDAEDLVQRMARADVIVRDPLVSDVLGGRSPDVVRRAREAETLELISSTAFESGVVGLYYKPTTG